MKRKALFTLATAALIGLAACSDNRQNDGLHSDSSNVDRSMTMSDLSEERDQAQAEITGTKGDTTVTGTARFERRGDVVAMKLDLHVPSKANSTVAVHFHEHGDCSNNGEDAHGHWNPTGENHGEWNKGNYHSGDIGNIKLDKDGKATVSIETNRWTIGGGSNTNILGKAIIVHSGVDDYKTQPTGNSGSRIGCGVVNSM